MGANELLEGEHLVEVPGIQNPPLATPSVIYADYMRELGSAGGEQDYVVPARVQTVTPMPHAVCGGSPSGLVASSSSSKGPIVRVGSCCCLGTPRTCSL